MSTMRFLPAGVKRLLVEMPSLTAAQALFASLARDPIEDIVEIVPAARTLLLTFQPGWDLPAVVKNLRARDLSAAPEDAGAHLELPVLYDGEDLDEVAQLTGLSRETVIERHASAEYTVAFTGFAPGFAYMSGGHPSLQVPRRQSPRTRIPAESVAIAGEFCGIYPRASPGGWQILGRTPVRMFDEDRDPPILLKPGMRVRFRPLADEAAFERAAAERCGSASTRVGSSDDRDATSHLVVEATPLPAVFQDLGRPGRTDQGIGRSGALDRESFREANRLVGNAADSACLEIVAGGFAFRAEERAVVALAGAVATLKITTADGRSIVEPSGRPVALEAGDRVTLGVFTRGARAYLAVRGGFVLERRFGSWSTDTLAGIGPEPAVAGSVLRVGSVSNGPAVGDPASAPALPAAGETVTLDLVLGPRTDWFTPEAVKDFLARDWLVTPRSNRIGLRLSGGQGLVRTDPGAELPSEGTAYGAVQVPHDGQPVLFLADHPLTGGYPVIGVVAEHHLDLAGQVPVGAFIRFRALHPFRPFDEEPALS